MSLMVNFRDSINVLECVLFGVTVGRRCDVFRLCISAEIKSLGIEMYEADLLPRSIRLRLGLETLAVGSNVYAEINAREIDTEQSMRARAVLVGAYMAQTRVEL